ncbi:MAG: Eco57I restriction-modification methylase domain-containing protein, partial [Candidatus Thorarchaeota archaeon]
SDKMRFFNQSDFLSKISKISHLKEIADIFFPVDSKRIESLKQSKRKMVNNTLLNFIRAFSWNLDLKSKIDKTTITPEIFETIYSLENISNQGLAHTPYFFASWIVKSCFQRHLSRILKVKHFSINNLDSLKEDKIEILKKAISHIKILDMSVGSGVFYLAALEFLLELYHRLFLGDKSTLSLIKRILKECLYGIDIDEKALVVCKLRVILRLLQENPNLQINDILEIITSINLKTGNTLVGFITIPEKTTNFDNTNLNELLFHGIEDERGNLQQFINNLKAFHWFNEFPKVFNLSGITGFDIIIGNPPYIGYRFLDNFQKHILKNLYPKIYTGLNNYYYYFIWRVRQLLTPHGSGALLVARYFLEAKYAQKLRSQLFKSNSIDALIDFREFKIFPKGVNSVILYLTNFIKSTEKIPVYILKNHKISPKTLLRELETVFESSYLKEKRSSQNFAFLQAEFKDNRFLLVSNILKELLNRIEDQGVPLNQVCDIGTGYHSGKDKIFSPKINKDDKGFFIEIKNNNSITHHPLEKTVIKRIVKSTDILPFRINEMKKKYVIFTKRGININDFPLTKQYLEKYKENLKKRYEVRRGLAKWYEIAQVRNPQIYNAKTKIICPYRSRVPRFAIDRNQRYSSIDCTSLIPRDSNFPDIYFILGVLNSELIEFYLAVVAKKLDAKKIELYPKTLSQIPLKLPQTRKDQVFYNEITEITKKIWYLLESFKLKPEHHRILLKYGKKGLIRIGEDAQILLKLIESLDMLVYQLYNMKDKIDIFRSEIINS